ncbi:MAG: Nuclease [Sphingomonas bacterium]|uniref:S1/P1 nuclease n=1 Tax=Sphingomonas bacterium TaxID=1895847 RepID=UPI002617A677|nr:S1/P1 nuclease [Sphingomonas bacterium]MDB5706355.1 Nuclease [Sphingomonas bacterium]
MGDLRTRGKSIAVLACALALAQNIAPARAWGPQGHRIIAAIALQRLTPTTRTRLDALMQRDPAGGESPGLESWSTWADTFRLEAPATRAWHFVDIPIDGESSIEAACRPTATPSDSAIAKGRNVDARPTKAKLNFSVLPPIRSADPTRDVPADVPVPMSAVDSSPAVPAPTQSESTLADGRNVDAQPAKAGVNSSTAPPSRSADPTAGRPAEIAAPVSTVASSPPGSAAPASEQVGEGIAAPAGGRILASQDTARYCLTDKLYDFAAELSDPSVPDNERIVGVKYLVHFIGDVHQPLHTADNDDAGGNCVAISVPGALNGLSLHSYWDILLVRELGTETEAVSAMLARRISQDDAAAWSSDVSAARLGKAEGWASAWTLETHGVAKTVAYSGPTRATCGRRDAPLPLDDDYRVRAREAVALQLEKAGVRVAAVLNTLFDPDSGIGGTVQNQGKAP